MISCVNHVDYTAPSVENVESQQLSLNTEADPDLIKFEQFESESDNCTTQNKLSTLQQENTRLQQQLDEQRKLAAEERQRMLDSQSQQDEEFRSQLQEKSTSAGPTKSASS